MLNAVKSVLAVVLSIRPSSEQSFTTSKISFTYILYLQCVYIWFISYTHNFKQTFANFSRPFFIRPWWPLQTDRWHQTAGTSCVPRNLRHFGLPFRGYGVHRKPIHTRGLSIGWPSQSKIFILQFVENVRHSILIKITYKNEFISCLNSMLFIPFTPKLMIQILLTIQEQMYEWCSENW